MNRVILSAEECPQGSEIWFKNRAGLITASEFSTIMAVKKDAKDKKTRRTYMLKLAGEIITGQPAESYSNGYMERGKAQEPEARDLYAFMRDEAPFPVGFIISPEHRCGYSPDSLVGEKGALEIKTALPHIQIERILSGALPSEHRAQCQGGLWVAEREWIDFASYCPGLDLFVTRVYRDEAYIEQIAKAVAQFNDELAEIIEQLNDRAEPLAERLRRSVEIGKIEEQARLLQA